MGAEATGPATFNGQSSSGKARLETDVLRFRGGDLKLSIPFKDIEKVSSCKGMLSVTFRGETASFDLGAASTRWADKIKNPPSRLQKIGVKPEWRASASTMRDFSRSWKKRSRISRSAASRRKAMRSSTV